MRNCIITTVILLLLLLTGTTSALSGSNLSVEVDGNGHLWAENDFYKWDVSHGTELTLKTGPEWRNWRIPGYESYRIELGDGGGNPTSPSYGVCYMSDLVVQSIDNRGTYAVVMLSGVFSYWQQPLSVKMTFYAQTSFVKFEMSVGNVWSDPHPPAIWWRVSLVPGGDTSPGDYYHYSGQSGEALFPYNSWTAIYESSFQTVGSTEFAYITDYDKEAGQGFAMIAKLQETADAITDINYGRASIGDYHGYGGYSVMTIHANSVISPTVYWFFYEADESVAYQPVEDLINSGDLLREPPMNVALDIKPGSCPNPLNVTSGHAFSLGEEDVLSSKIRPDAPQPPRAVVPVAILGTEDFDVSAIVPSSIRLEGVPAVRWNVEDVATPVGDNAAECECNTLGADGHPDLTLKFLREQLIGAIGDVQSGDVITLTISGELSDGTPFEGQDCMVIVGGQSSPQAASSIEVMNSYPNPFNPTTTIAYSVSQAGPVALEIYNVLGEKVRTLVDQYQTAGNYEVTWDSRNNHGEAVSSGIYFYHLRAGDLNETKKMVLMK